MVFYRKEERLTNEIIAAWSEEAAQQYMQEAGKRALSEAKIRFALEELLLKFRDTYGTETPCRLTGKRLPGQITFELRQAGRQQDPIAPEEELQASYDILSRLGVSPRYTYSARRGVNCVTLTAEMKPVRNKMLFLMLGAVVLSVLCCLGLRAAAPNVGTLIYESLTKPIFDKLTSVIAALATPLVFLAVITGITGLDDAASFGRIGTRVCGAMGLAYLIAAGVLTLFGVFTYPLDMAAGAGESRVLAQTVQLVLDIIPDNLLYPFTIDNDLQVIALAIFMGVVMLMLGDQLRGLNGLIREAAGLINRMMAIVCRLLPLVVFLGIFNLLYSSDPKEFVSVYRVFLLFAVICGIVIVISVIRTRIVTKVPFGVIFRKVLPTLTINLTTSSQVAALPENMHCCKDKFGIDAKLVDFALPLGIVVYMPCGAVFLGLTVLSMAEITGTALTLSAFIRMVIIAIILAIAAPPIPGSVFAVLPIMFTACGVPESVYPLAVLLGTILGYLLPAFNGFLLQLELLRVAVKMKKIDMEKLRSPLAD